MSQWHAEVAALREYAAGRTPLPVTASLEAHLLRCDECRALLRDDADRGRHAAVWDRVVDDVLAGPESRAPRGRRGRGQLDLGHVRLPGRRAPCACRRGGLRLRPGRRPDLGDRARHPQRAAPPGYSPGGHGAGGRPSAPVPGGSLLPWPAWTAAAWLLPALACTALTLALSTWFPVSEAALGITALWVVITAVASGPGFRDVLLVLSTPMLSLYVVVAVVAALVFWLRLDRLATLGRIR